MNITAPTQLDTSFRDDVFKGLTSFPKYLNSKYIYDKAGDTLFQEIMELPEYYLTNCEFNIISSHTKSITQLFKDEDTGFDLIELGAGDGKKTKVLLKYLCENNIQFTYKPIDISEHAIKKLTKSLTEELPLISVDPEIGTYFQVLEKIKQYNTRKKAIMLLGSNIGNLSHPKAIEFLSRLRDSMNDEDVLFMGFDQKKNPQIILDAYDDPSGVTAEFNKNLLHRINRELGGNFNVDLFKHWEVYNPESGTAKSYLVAQEAQEVTINRLDLTVHFDAWETIHTEISQKYDDKIVKWLTTESGLVIKTSFTDKKGYYKNYVFKKA